MRLLLFLKADDTRRSFVYVLFTADVLSKDSGECSICLEDLVQGETIARLACLCVYHKRYKELLHTRLMYRSFLYVFEKGYPLTYLPIYKVLCENQNHLHSKKFLKSCTVHQSFVNT